MRNPVAKHGRHFNRAAQYRDRKKAVKRGYQKHKPRHDGRGFSSWGSVLRLPTGFAQSSHHPSLITSEAR